MEARAINSSGTTKDAPRQQQESFSETCPAPALPECLTVDEQIRAASSTCRHATVEHTDLGRKTKGCWAMGPAMTTEIRPQNASRPSGKCRLLCGASSTTMTWAGRETHLLVRAAHHVDTAMIACMNTTIAHSRRERQMIAAKTQSVQYYQVWRGWNNS